MSDSILTSPPHGVPACSACDETENKSVVRRNAEKDANYNPYCMRCSGPVRMRKIEPMLWRCQCGAVHDERTAFEMLAPGRSIPSVTWSHSRVEEEALKRPPFDVLDDQARRVVMFAIDEAHAKGIRRCLEVVKTMRIAWQVTRPEKAAAAVQILDTLDELLDTVHAEPKCPWCIHGIIAETGILCRTCKGSGKATSVTEEQRTP